jgi:hypothetical protein
MQRHPGSETVHVGADADSRNDHGQIISHP